MKAWMPLLSAAALVSLGFTQDIQHQISTINVEVPVRVFQGDRFVDDLKLQDFEVYDNGLAQKIEAVYLVRNKDVLRKEELKKFSPDTSRSYYLYFEISQYFPQIAEAVDSFIGNVLMPGDYLTLITPVKTYSMKRETLAKIPRTELIRQLTSIIRKDATKGGAAYRKAILDLSQAANTLVQVLAYPNEEARMLTVPGQMNPGGTGPETALANYEAMLEKIENLRSIEQKNLLGLAEHLKKIRGQKNIFLFYQREFLPQIDPNLLQKYQEAHQDDFIKYKVSSLFQFYHRDIEFDVEKVKQAFSDSSITINFMFYSIPPDNAPGIRMVEFSEDIFSAFNEMARATGGIVVSSANPGYLFRKAVESTENYYLLYYAPSRYRADHTFHKIEVRIKGGGLRVSHRAGYFAD